MKRKWRRKEGRLVAGWKTKTRWKEKNVVVLEFPLSLPLACHSFVSCLLPSNAKDIIVASPFCNYCDAYMSIYLAQDFPGGSGGKEIYLQCRKPRFGPWIRKIPWRRHGYPLENSRLEKPTDRGTWQATVHRAAKSQTGLTQLRAHPLSPVHGTCSVFGKCHCFHHNASIVSRCVITKSLLANSLFTISFLPSFYPL